LRGNAWESFSRAATSIWMLCRGTVGRDIALRCLDGAARRPYQTAADEQEHEHE
jgi:hypothetical protein